ncbi:hypothetical protein E6P09_12540 [Haloferax mediterranei ATCC 33500]|uniref:DUF8101 domain-containing protein n=1 Tax=Haloferax mediterranei (strain ATCC 33500 / DSM 1411 / JCM 8866 / NBRC 14739 / NCIMB 2177 / R-4) TaxID=523841 RepID=I3R8F8_HALMT|nr:hypothetical protein [Haloferax mediterranei]AFK20518.1 hypothetical protein HFX_2848 [Haloferax mediterranei ATCC 33500]AHZ23876.1 hypothetical protein BM92_15035 [Haloferax mediterranei ATCC 33500]ELZ98300.1 hypothetical protein C439_15985 [Haloferax mediterranei ATCC 33500]MDX5986727.1 hypothetical protein [Haloferax mediterranei ATCC 33500]QCQ76051.1 hypothetical protein E6P09_12540 [Haloferax mediterranei ATCC 33500]
MTDAVDLPVRVRDALTAAFGDAREAIRSGDTETARECTEKASRILQHKVPPSPLKEQLKHGLAAVERTVADEPLVASEYLRLMKQLLDE